MKALKNITAIICALLIVFAFAACGKSASGTGDNPLSKYAGEYTFYCVNFADAHVLIDEFVGTTTTLKEDGTGYLNWGEDNKGPISEWTVDDDSAGSITIKAGVSTMPAVVKDGIMTVTVDEGVESVYVLEGADTSAIPTISAQEYSEQMN